MIKMTEWKPGINITDMDVHTRFIGRMCWMKTDCKYNYTLETYEEMVLSHYNKNYLVRCYEYKNHFAHRAKRIDAVEVRTCL